MLGLLIAALGSLTGRTKRQVEQAKADELRAELERAKGEANEGHQKVDSGPQSPP